MIFLPYPFDTFDFIDSFLNIDSVLNSHLSEKRSHLGMACDFFYTLLTDLVVFCQELLYLYS